MCSVDVGSNRRARSAEWDAMRVDHTYKSISMMLLAVCTHQIHSMHIRYTSVNHIVCVHCIIYAA